ncbi:hypothetical protein AXG93_4019s1000 [Marchantia polymorpha subsp. ruderalis]|uniref:Uncharacterized protein n=2 Tax=Marchantia polymorpha subsp. ruderalis TaxID=1480154 RepID=A0A176WMS3_MARPO|nr:hypothetical protein AXG93_4019s1000 [Marchantia polymorpha subsp. ruderalis]
MYQLNDSVYELHNPGVESVLDVVFFHGLQSSHTSVPHLSTWISSGSHKEVWPQTWIPQEFPGARILSVEYDASISTSPTHGRLDLYLTAESLMYNLIIAKVGQHPWRPVILVGHSYGGLVIKQLCLHVSTRRVLSSDKQMAGFLNSVTGIFFYGTPHLGISSFFTPDGTKLKDASPLLDYVKLLCAESARLHQNFDDLRRSYEWSIAGVGESRPTTFMLDAESQNAVAVCSEVIVVEASARYGDFTVEHEDHISLCQPESRKSNSYIRLTSFLQSTYNNEVNRRTLRLEVPKMAMSLHSHFFVEVQKILRKAPIIALHGMGGIGKTTLAKLLFNKLCAKFEYTCFLTKSMFKGDTKEERDRIVSSSLYHYGKQVLQRGGTWEKTLMQKKLLFVLDDFDNDMHVELLQDVVNVNSCANSRYIVTSRDKHILNQLEFAECECECYVFDVKHLNQESSTELFMSHAFPKSTEPSPSLKDCIVKIVAKCDGLPLTLEVMGKYLKGKDNKSESYWKECFHALDEADNALRLDDRLWKKLKVSYDRLSSEEQEMFLDAASFFSNSRWTLQEAKASWRVLYGSQDLRWDNLVNLSLVYEVKEQDSIQMHEQLKSLGIRLASGWETGGRCRTWTHKNVPSKFNPSNYDERIEDTLFYSSDSRPHCNATHIEEVIALRLEDSMPLDSRNIGQMKKLRYLDSEKELMLDEIGGKLPKNVALLRFHGEVNNLHDMVDKWFAGRLAVLDLNAPLTCWPTTVSKFQNLEVLKFAACFFEGLPETFAQLPMLRYLTFTSCPRLRSLPEAFGQLSQLGSLEIDECCNLEALPNSFGQLPCLQTFNIAMTSNLQRLPDGFGNLSKLQSLVIDGGREISELPESFGRLSRLQALELHGMTSLKALPDSFGNLSELQSLEIDEDSLGQRFQGDDEDERSKPTIVSYNGYAVTLRIYLGRSQPVHVRAVFYPGIILEGKQSDTEQQVNGGGPLHSGEQEVMFLNETENERREEAESGEIEEEKDEKDDGVVMQPLPSFVVANNNHSCEGRVRETRRKHRKADLEDGELDDAATMIPILFLFVLYLAPPVVPTTTAIFRPSFSFVNSPLLASWTWFLLLRAARLFLSSLNITCG